MALRDALAAFLVDHAGVRPGDGIVVAFSGGADSTALLHGLHQLAPELGLRLVAAHLDHGLDPGSAERAAAAREAAASLGVRCEVARLPVVHRGPRAAGVEAEARRVRYRWLEDVRRGHRLRWIATAHHRDDQAETVLLRASFGSGPLGLAGIQPVRGSILRPLLGVRRADLRAALEEAGLDWSEDPTNRDPARPRNRLRLLLAAAAPGDSELGDRLAAIAARARGARDAIDRGLRRELDLRREFDGASVELSAMRRLSSTLVSIALASLHREAGIAYPASRRAATEIVRQLERVGSGGAGCDCGAGLRWEVRGPRLHLSRREPREPTPVLFTYTLELPGEVEVKELSLRFRVLASPRAPWMDVASPRRAALALPPERGYRLTVRNRRPGDHIRPLGWDQSCRVKDLLINRKVPRRDRSLLPLLASGSDVIWIPGVTVDDRYRVGAERRVRGADRTECGADRNVWVAEIDRPGPRL